VHWQCRLPFEPPPSGNLFKDFSVDILQAIGIEAFFEETPAETEKEKIPQEGYRYLILEEKN